MPSLEDLAAVTGRLDQLTTELHSELTQGSIDFRKMVGLADDIGRHSDRLAAAFNTMAEALETSLEAATSDGDEDAADGE
ncbi:MAG: hypothetical protein ICV64_09365 [Thermoleophilia bacterium]|nr:hypothetical protein [Thermoleophilia bacterium]